MKFLFNAGAARAYATASQSPMGAWAAKPSQMAFPMTSILASSIIAIRTKAMTAYNS
jgi:hypothetical protein